MRLAGKAALITGATRGAGEAMAQRFAAEGAAVAVVGRNAEAGRAIVGEIGARGGRAIWVAADVTSEDAVASAVDETATAFGRLDILVNNAGPMEEITTGGDQPIVGQPTAAFERILEVGLYGMFWGCKYAIPHMLEAGGGVILCSSSVTALHGELFLPSYTAAKGAVIALTRQLAVEYGGQGIRANALVFGAIENARMESVPVPGLKDALRALQITRLATPDDCASAALFLASDEAACITGQTLVVDGGTLIKGGLPTGAIVASGHA